MKRYEGQVTVGASAYAIGVSPDGSMVFVTGYARGYTEDDYATIAYNASTGAQLWAKRYGQANTTSDASALGVSPDGTKVFVTGSSDDGTNSVDTFDYLTLAYSAV